MHKFNNTILRAYDIRGVFNKTLFCNDAYFIAKAFFKYLLDNNYHNNIVIGYDGRKSSTHLKDSLVKGFIESGANIKLIHLCPTPMLYYAVNYLKCDAGIMITGSHNPKDHNGFKITLKDKPFFGSEIQHLANIVDKGEFVSGKGNVADIEIENKYIERLMQDIENINDISDIKIAWDCGNGATGNVITNLTSKLANINYKLYEKIDGNFPNHHPDPSDIKNMIDLQKKVKDKNCDFGIAFDGDGDRIGVVDDLGEVISGDDLMIIFAKEVINNNPGCRVIADVKASNILFDKITEFGGIAIMHKTGHSFIKSKLKEVGALLAGEMSGHIFFADKYYGFDDAIYSAIRLINIIKKSKKKLSELRKEIPKKYSTSEIRINCDDNIKFNLINEIKKYLIDNNYQFNDIDGIRCYDHRGWWLLRASNTQPAIVARCEAISQIYLDEIKQELHDIMNKYSLLISISELK